MRNISSPAWPWPPWWRRGLRLPAGRADPCSRSLTADGAILRARTTAVPWPGSGSTITGSSSARRAVSRPVPRLRGRVRRACSTSTPTATWSFLYPRARRTTASCAAGGATRSRAPTAGASWMCGAAGDRVLLAVASYVPLDYRDSRAAAGERGTGPMPAARCGGTRSRRWSGSPGCWWPTRTRPTRRTTTATTWAAATVPELRLRRPLRRLVHLPRRVQRRLRPGPRAAGGAPLLLRHPPLPRRPALLLPALLRIRPLPVQPLRVLRRPLLPGRVRPRRVRSCAGGAAAPRLQGEHRRALRRGGAAARLPAPSGRRAPGAPGVAAAGAQAARGAGAHHPPAAHPERRSSEPSRAEPQRREEPRRVEPSRAAPRRVEPSRAEPRRADLPAERGTPQDGAEPGRAAARARAQQRTPERAAHRPAPPGSSTRALAHGRFPRSYPRAVTAAPAALPARRFARRSASMPQACVAKRESERIGVRRVRGRGGGGAPCSRRDFQVRPVPVCWSAFCARPRHRSREPSVRIDHIRNFCIVAHIDHGKSTLADRLIEATGTLQAAPDEGAGPGLHGPGAGAGHHHQAQRRADGVPRRATGVPTSSTSSTRRGTSTSPTRCRAPSPRARGRILVVDASQGIQAQTLSNLFLALDAGLEIIPVLNKIDLPGAEPERRRDELVDLLGVDPDEVILASAKEGVGVAGDPRGDRAPGAAARGRSGGGRRARSSSTRTTTSTWAPSPASGWWTASSGRG